MGGIHQLCCIYTRVEVWDESDKGMTGTDTALVGYDGSMIRYANQISMMDAVKNAIAAICDMPLGSQDCKDQTKCWDELEEKHSHEEHAGGHKPGHDCEKSDKKMCGLREGCRYKRRKGCILDNKWKKELKKKCKNLSKKSTDCGVPDSGCKVKGDGKQKMGKRVRCVPDL